MTMLDESNIVIARAIYSCITQKIKPYNIIIIIYWYISLTSEITKFDLCYLSKYGFVFV